MKAKTRSTNVSGPWARAAWLGSCLMGGVLAAGMAGAQAAEAPPTEPPVEPAKVVEPAAEEGAPAKAEPAEESAEKSEGKDQAGEGEKSESGGKAEEGKAEEGEQGKEGEEGKAGEEAEAPEPLTPAEFFEGGKESYSNWVTLSGGGFLTKGNRAQAEERHRRNRDGFGGIEDLHYQADLSKSTVLTLDGRAIFDQHDYGLSLLVRNEEVGYVRLSYSQYRTWSNADGGYYAAGPGRWYDYAGDDALGLDRGEIGLEAGLTKEKLPRITYKYTHRFRDGQKASTSWGLSHPDFTALTRGVTPSLYNIDERSDTFELDVAHTIKKTDVGVGLRYEVGEHDDARLMTQWLGEPTQRRVTDTRGTDYDQFSAHAYTETWLKKNLLFSSGFLFATLDSDYSGGRVYGDDFDVSYAPNPFNGLGYTGLQGGGQNQEYLLNLNLLWKPKAAWSLVPSVRVRKEAWEADSSALRTAGNSIPALATSTMDSGLLDVMERVDATYTGVTNFVFYVRGEWTQGQGDRDEVGGLEEIAPVGRRTEDERFFQKYSAGTRWYAAKPITVDVGGYYKHHAYDYDHEFDSTRNWVGGNRYPAFLEMQDFRTYDANARLTWRPLRNVSLVTRYEYQISHIDTTPDPASGLGEAEASEMVSHVVGQNVGWTPWRRLHLQAGFNYVNSVTETPASEYTQAVLDARNNYLTLNFNAGLVVDDRTDLNLGYFYYLADNDEYSALMNVPLGAAAEEHGMTAMVTRRLSKSVRLNLKYGYFRYDDTMSGGNLDNEAHLIYSGLQYRF